MSARSLLAAVEEAEDELMTGADYYDEPVVPCSTLRRLLRASHSAALLAAIDALARVGDLDDQADLQKLAAKVQSLKNV